MRGAASPARSHGPEQAGGALPRSDSRPWLRTDEAASRASCPPALVSDAKPGRELRTGAGRAAKRRCSRARGPRSAGSGAVWGTLVGAHRRARDERPPRRVWEVR